MTPAVCNIQHRVKISTHMPLARHDKDNLYRYEMTDISTHMPLARHDRHVEELR